MPNWAPCASIPELSSLFEGQSAQRDSSPAALISPLRSTIRGIRARHLVPAVILLLALAAFGVWRVFFYSPPQDDLLSSFSLQSGATAVEVLKVEKLDGAYLLFRMQRSGWSDGEPVAPMAEKEFVELFGNEWKAARPVGLVGPDGQAAILKVQPGWTNGEFTCKTGYFFMNSSGPVELVKTEPKALGLPSLARKTPQPTPSPTATATPTPRPQVRRTPAPAPRRTPTPSPQPPPSRVTVVPLAPRPTASPTPPGNRSSGPQTAPEQSTSPDQVSPTASPTPGSNGNSQALATLPPGAKADTEAGLRTELAQARQNAESARARLAQIDLPARRPFQRLFLESGAMLMDTSRELEAEGDLAAAISYAQQAEKAYREGQEKLGGAAR